MLSKWSLIALVGIGLSFSVGCSSSNFAGSNGSTKAAKGKDKSKDDEETDPDDEDKDEDPGEGEAEGGEDPDKNGTDEDADADKPKAGEIISEEEAACLLEKGDDFRILFALDNSGSTTQTDPANIRRSASMKLIDQFTDFVKANPKVRFRTATVAIHGKPKSGSYNPLDTSVGATPGPNGWVDLKPSTRGKIESDITMSTETDPSQGTYFLRGYGVIKSLLEAEKASPQEKKQRNYVIFLTDGKANGPGDTNASIASGMQEIVDTFGVAVYSILVGDGKKESNGIQSPVQAMQSIALPTTGVVGPDHVGVHVHAKSPAEVEAAFSDFFKNVTTCK